MNFRVIGVMESKGGGPGGNLDKSIFLPLTTGQDRLFKQKNPNGKYKVSVIYASIDDADNIPLAQEEDCTVDAASGATSSISIKMTSASSARTT